MSDEPTQYNELVELVENNEPGVVAQVIQDTHTPNQEVRELIEGIRGWAEQYGDEYGENVDLLIEREIAGLIDRVEDSEAYSKE